MSDALAFRFMGVGNARATELGSASGTLEINGRPDLLIDCGPHTLDDFSGHYGGELPRAVFLTHLHFDHVGGIEQLFYRSYFTDHAPIKLIVPAPLVPALHEKLAGSPYILSEGGANFWDAFQLIPAGDYFWLGKRLFNVFPVRHSGYRGGYGIALKGAFFYSGDTRPIPELTAEFATGNALVFHDCAEFGSPAHTGLADFEREYSGDVRERAVLYHYESAAAALRIEATGLRVARQGQRFELPLP